MSKPNLKLSPLNDVGQLKQIIKNIMYIGYYCFTWSCLPFCMSQKDTIVSPGVVYLSVCHKLCLLHKIGTPLRITKPLVLLKPCLSVVVCVYPL